MNPDFNKHAVDIVKGALGAFITAGCLAALNYFGAHIPDLLQYLTTGGGAVAAIKMMRPVG